MFHAHFMHYTESDHQKLGGPIHCWSPPTKKLGGLVSPGPHGCCAYATAWQRLATRHQGEMWPLQMDNAAAGRRSRSHCQKQKLAA